VIYDEELSQMPSSKEQDLSQEEPDEVSETAAPTILVSPYHTSRDLFQAHSALLDHMVVSVETHPDLYRLVRMHLTTLQRWHEEHTGWRIQRKPTFFRLERHLHAITPVALDEKLKRPRDFVCLTLLLWFAEKRYLAGGERNQLVLLSQLAEALQEQSQGIGGGPALDFRNQQDRLSMWRALDSLIRVGGLRELEGEAKKWAEAAEQEEIEVLYEFTPVAHSLIEALSEERVMAIANLVFSQQEQLLPPGVLSPLAQKLPPLLRAWRTLLLSPAFLRYDDPEAFSVLFQQAQHVNETLSKAFGWLLELNDNYACVVRVGNPAGPTLTSNGASQQMILLLCTRFRQQIEQHIWSPDCYGCLSVSHSHELRNEITARERQKEREKEEKTGKKGENVSP
jgi:uncharacterized protein (TIGR02678 family)